MWAVVGGARFDFHGISGERATVVKEQDEKRRSDEEDERRRTATGRNREFTRKQPRCSIVLPQKPVLQRLTTNLLLFLTSFGYLASYRKYFAYNSLLRRVLQWRVAVKFDSVGHDPCKHQGKQKSGHFWNCFWDRNSSCKGDKKAWSLLGQRRQASNKKSQNLQGAREEWRLEEYARKSFTMAISSTKIREGLSNRIDE